MGGFIEEADKTATYPLCTTDLLVIVLVNDLSYAEMMEHLCELSVEVGQEVTEAAHQFALPSALTRNSINRRTLADTYCRLG